MKATPRPFVPALGLHSLTGFYDGLIARFLAEDVWKAQLVATIAPKPGDVIVDLGCGTGTLGLLLKATSPQTTVIGIDPDPAMLGRARAKAAEGNLDIRFVQAFADALPLDSGSATAVVSSLVLHHLEQPTKRAAFTEAFRVLRPGGRIVIADWATPDNLLMRLAYVSVQVFDGFPNTRDNLQGLLPVLMRQARFEDVREVYRRRTIFGNLAFLHGTKPFGGDAP